MSEYTGSPKYRERDISWYITSFLIRFSLNFLLDTSSNYFMGFFNAVNEVNSKNSQISRSLINFQEKNSHLQGVSSALEMTFHIQALFKDFKDLHEPWDRTSSIKGITRTQKTQSCLTSSSCYNWHNKNFHYHSFPS